MWVNFTSGWPNLQFKADSERQIFEKLFHGDFSLNFTQSFCQNSAERKSPKIYSFHSFFVLMSDCGLASNKPTHYLLNYGDFRQIDELKLILILAGTKQEKLSHLEHRKPTRIH